MVRCALQPQEPLLPPPPLTIVRAEQQRTNFQMAKVSAQCNSYEDLHLIHEKLWAFGLVYRRLCLSSCAKAACLHSTPKEADELLVEQGKL